MIYEPTTKNPDVILGNIIGASANEASVIDILNAFAVETKEDRKDFGWNSFTARNMYALLRGAIVYGYNSVERGNVLKMLPSDGRGDFYQIVVK